MKSDKVSGLEILAGFLVVLIIVLALSCRKPVEQFTSIETIEMERIGDPSRMPDLYIPEADTDWDGYPSPFVYGLYGVTSSIFNIATGKLSLNFALSYGLDTVNTYTFLKYPCRIANRAEQVPDGGNDFVIDQSEQGIPGGAWGNYNYPGLLEVTLFRSNGLQTRKVSKQSFGITNTDYKLGYDWSLFRDYRGDTMWISAQAGDEYHNIMPIDGALDGEYVLSVHINPPDSTGVRPVTESNYTNNVSTLGFRVLGGVPTPDKGIVAKTKPVPVTNLTGQHIGRGVKEVRLNWDCPYHEPYVRHSFRILKQDFDGSTTVFEVEESELVDRVKGNFRGAEYHIQIFIPGLGYSDVREITIER